MRNISEVNFWAFRLVCFEVVLAVQVFDQCELLAVAFVENFFFAVGWVFILLVCIALGVLMEHQSEVWLDKCFTVRDQVLPCSCLIVPVAFASTCHVIFLVPTCVLLLVFSVVWFLMHFKAQVYFHFV